MKRKDTKHLEALLKIKSIVEKENDFLITTHIRSDGDSISSILLFASLLRFLKKQYFVVIDDRVPRKFNFLPGVQNIQNSQIHTCPFKPRCVVVMDCSHIDRIGSARKFVDKDAIIINLDHHPGNDRFGQYNVVDPNESSTVEIVYALYSLWDITPSPDEATLIYTGIVSDTGKFMFPNTTSRSLSISSEMVKYGAKPDQIASNLYFRNTSGTLRALASALETLEFHYDGAVSCIHLSYENLTGNGEVDTEGFVDYLLTIEKSEIVFFMLEEKKDCFRVSFRSKNRVDVNAVSKQFGGGGHNRASGCCIRGKLEEVKNQILDRLKTYL